LTAVKKVDMETIMIVDDHAGMRTSLGDLLRAVFPPFRIMEAANGEDAIAYARACPLNVIVMDIGLPGVNGIETTRAIKTIMPATRVVMLSIYEEENYREDARLAGASAYVRKRTMQTDLVPALQRLFSDFTEADAAPVSG
jgi:DNA-binding NarL/FixJ family response regulator